MGFSDLVVWVSGLTAITAFGTTLWNILTSGARANSKVIAEHSKEIDQLTRRVDHLEDAAEHAPSADGLHRLELAITRLDGELNTFNERLKPVAAIVDRMQELMIREARG